jgi:hypothetical protein
MRAIIIAFFISFLSQISLGQPPTKQQEPANSNTEQQLENITENSEDENTEDDFYLQQLSSLQRNPINLNTASADELKQTRLLSVFQINNLINYRTLLGKLIDIYELQAVPSFDIATIQKIRQFVTVNENADLINTIGNRLKNGDHTLLFRATQVLEKSKGFLVNPATTKNYYPGSAQRLFVRYRYNYKNNLQYGFVGEKDAGEQLFKGAQKNGFDFYSAHFFARNIGIVKSLAVGDYTVNLGQGLTSWMSLAFKKGPDVLATKREASVLNPYNSAGEIFFHRGVGVTLKKKNIETTLFASYKKTDANFDRGLDTLQTQDDFVSSIQTSGFHRTASEAADKGIQRQLAFGGNVSYNKNNFHVGINGVQYNLKYPLVKSNEPYNYYALSGSNFGNYSADYSLTKNNFHFFGEAAISSKAYLATINGLLISVANYVDMSFVYRNISKGYQALYTNTFTESSTASNEKGLFSGISLKPSNAWKIDAYVDFYSFPWLKFRLNAPSTGKDHLLQVTYKPSKVFEIYTRFKSESKAINNNPTALPLSPVIARPKQSWRTQFTYKLNPTITFRSRVEALWFDRKSEEAESGFLMYADVIFKPALKPFSGNMRLQYFETDSYNSRLYAYENDVLYSYSIPVFYETGYRYYLNLNYDVNKKLSLWARIAQTLSPGKKSIGSGLDEITGNHKTEVKFQAMYRF